MRGSGLITPGEPCTLPEIGHPVLIEVETCFRQALDPAFPISKWCLVVLPCVNVPLEIEMSDPAMMVWEAPHG